MVDRSSEIFSRHIETIRAHAGELINGLLAETDVTDIILNPPRPGETDGRLWVTRLGRDREHVGFMTAEQAIRLIGAVAATMNRQVDAQSPRIEGKLITDGSRFLGGIPPVAKAPFFCIRRHSSKLFTIADYVASGQMTRRQAAVIYDAVKRRLNIIICGGTGSGKTTLMNALIHAMTEVNPEHRFYGIEEAPELQCFALDQLFTLTTENISIQDLVRTAMRAFADRILVGEARGGEMLSILQVWNTGHDGGAATIHSNTSTPEAALERIEDMVSMAPNPPAAPQRMIGRTVGLIICLAFNEQKQREVKQIVSVHGYDRNTGNYITQQEI